MNIFKEKGIGHIPDSTHTKWPAGDGAKARVPYFINTNQFSKLILEFRNLFNIGSF